MKTGNLGIYLNFKNLSKTWHVNTNREQIHNGLFLSIHFHLLSNVMLFVEKLKYAKKSPRLAGLKIILSWISVENSLWGDNDMVGEINLICLHFLDFLWKALAFLSQWQWTIGDDLVISPIFLQTIELSAALDNKKYLEWLFMTTELTEITRRI